MCPGEPCDRQAGLLCVHMPAWVVPHSQPLIADREASQASVPSPHPCQSPMWLWVPSSSR